MQCVCMHFHYLEEQANIEVVRPGSGCSLPREAGVVCPGSGCGLFEPKSKLFHRALQGSHRSDCSAPD